MMRDLCRNNVSLQESWINSNQLRTSSLVFQFRHTSIVFDRDIQDPSPIQRRSVHRRASQSTETLSCVCVCVLSVDCIGRTMVRRTKRPPKSICAPVIGRLLNVSIVAPCSPRARNINSLHVKWGRREKYRFRVIYSRRINIHLPPAIIAREIDTTRFFYPKLCRCGSIRYSGQKPWNKLAICKIHFRYGVVFKEWTLLSLQIWTMQDDTIIYAGMAEDFM